MEHPVFNGFYDLILQHKVFYIGHRYNDALTTREAPSAAKVKITFYLIGNSAYGLYFSALVD